MEWFFHFLGYLGFCISYVALGLLWAKYNFAPNTLITYLMEVIGWPILLFIRVLVFIIEFFNELL